MKRLAIAAVGLALAAILAFGAGAFALYVWPTRDAEQQRAPVFLESEVRTLAKGSIADHVPFPSDTDVVLCPNVRYAPEKHLWVVTCDFFHSGQPESRKASRVYLFDDQTGELVP